jgi:hypothetical protein
VVVYLCVSGIDLVFFHDFDIEFRVVFFAFSFYYKKTRDTPKKFEDNKGVIKSCQSKKDMQ